MNNYEICLVKQVHSSFAAVSSEDAWLERCVTISMPPFPGLEIVVGDISATIKEVAYDANRRVTLCYVEEEKTLYDAGLKGGVLNSLVNRDTTRLEEIVAELIAEGWQRRE